MPKGSGGKVSSTKQKWIPKGSEKQAGKKGKENEEGAAQAGPKYDRNQLLRTYGTCKDGGALLVLQEANSMDEAPKELRYRTEARPEDENTSRKGSKEQKVEGTEERRPSTQLLVQELVTEGAAASAPADPAMITYLQSMVSAVSAFGMPGMYGAMGYPGYTTVMLRNIPNRYLREMLINRLDKGYEGLYDFVYLPIDFSSRCNVGYAFINFRTPAGAQRFMQEFHGAKTKQCLPGFGSAKVAEVSFARVQGREQNMENLRDEKFIEKLLDRPDWQPLFLDDAGKEIPFSKAFAGVSGEKRRNSKKTATPPYIPPSTPTGFMKPPPYFPAPTSFPSVATPAPPSMLASLLPSASKETLLMLRGVPLKYTREQFLDLLKRKYGSDFDFVFLPEKPDAQSEGPCNRGFAFVNFKSVETAKKFSEDFANKQVVDCFPEAEGEKACEISPARMESLEKSIERCQLLAAEKKDEKDACAWLPILIGDDGEVQKFPMIATADKKEKATDDANEASAGDKAEAEPKSKAKANRKGSKDGTPSGAPLGYPYPFGVGYPGYYGYQGYPAYPGYNPYQVYSQMAAAQSARAIQAAQLQARAKAAGRKGGQKGFHQNVLDPLAAAVNLKGDEQLSEDGRDRLRSQVEFYFSTNNLCKDLFLRQHMEPEGWTSLELISQFPMVRRFKVSLPTLIEVVSESTLFEIDKDAQKLRLANESERKKWAQAPVPLEYKVPA